MILQRLSLVPVCFSFHDLNKGRFSVIRTESNIKQRVAELRLTRALVSEANVRILQAFWLLDNLQWSRLGSKCPFLFQLT